MQQSKPSRGTIASLVTFLLAFISSISALVLALAFGYNPRTPAKLPLLSNAAPYIITKYQSAQFRLSTAITVGLCISVLSAFLGSVFSLMVLLSEKGNECPLKCLVGNNRILIYLCGGWGILSSTVASGLEISIIIEVLIPAKSITVLGLSSVSLAIFTLMLDVITIALVTTTKQNKEMIQQGESEPIQIKQIPFQPNRVPIYKFPIINNRIGKEQALIANKQRKNIKSTKKEQKKEQKFNQSFNKQNNNSRSSCQPLMENYLPYNILSDKQDQSLSYSPPIHQPRLIPTAPIRLIPSSRQPPSPKHQLIKKPQKIPAANAMSMSILNISAILPKNNSQQIPPTASQPSPASPIAQNNQNISILGQLRQGKIPEQISPHNSRPNLRQLRTNLQCL